MYIFQQNKKGRIKRRVSYALNILLIREEGTDGKHGGLFGLYKIFRQKLFVDILKQRRQIPGVVA